MKVTKKICSISIIVLFISLSLVPVINAGESYNGIFKIEYKDEKGDTYNIEIKTDQDQLQTFEDTWYSWEGILKDLREDGIIDKQELVLLEKVTITMFEELRNLTYSPILGEYLFPIQNIPTFIHDNLFMIGGGSRIFSIGRGRVWLPFNRQGEAFFGMKFAPIFLRHTIGFTRIRSCSFFPLSWFVLNRFFTHSICTMGFTGLYINLGQQFLDTSVGPIFLIGKPLFVRLTNDFL